MNLGRLSACLGLIFICNGIFGQENLPTDYLPNSFHAGRREALRHLMPANSVAVIFAFPERLYSNDVNYKYHPNPDLYYFSGYKEPDAVLVIFKELQQHGQDSYNELFFARERNPAREQWTGRRLGVEGVKAKLGLTHVFNSGEFKQFPIEFSKFSQVLYDYFPEDASGNMAGLINVFKDKARINSNGNKALDADLSRLANLTSYANLQQTVINLKAKMKERMDDAYHSNPLLLEFLANPDSAALKIVAAKIKKELSVPVLYNRLVGSLREIKTPEELVLLKKSVRLSSLAHAEVMKAIKPGMSETELEGIHTYIHKKLGAEEEGYPPIVGAGANGCILHYIENNSTRVNNQLVLMDVGAEYHGYTADITRTMPANGTFSPAQRAIYQLVYDAQDSIFQLCREGIPFHALNQKAVQVLADGLIKLGIINDKKEVYTYYPHGCSHHLGLDVHDKYASRILQQHMVITVEPGIYIPAGSPCDPKWWDIAVRIEDDVIIGKDQCTILSGDVPRQAEEVENKIAEKSILDQFTVPGL